MKIKIKLLKMKFKMLYREYNSILNEFSCGEELATRISSRVSELKTKLNNILDQLSKIDPKCPKTRI